MDFKLTSSPERQRLVSLLHYAFKQSAKKATTKPTLSCPIALSFDSFLENIKITFQSHFREFQLLNDGMNEYEYADYMWEIETDINRLRRTLKPGGRMTNYRVSSLCNNLNGGLYCALYTFRQLLITSAFPSNLNKQRDLYQNVNQFMEILYHMQDIRSVQSTCLKLDPLNFIFAVNICESREHLQSAMMEFLGYDQKKDIKKIRRCERKWIAYKENLFYKKLLFGNK